MSRVGGAGSSTGCCVPAQRMLCQRRACCWETFGSVVTTGADVAAAFPHLASAVRALHDRLADTWSGTSPVAYPALPRPGATTVTVPDDWDDSA